jgi:hypothetical protein
MAPQSRENLVAELLKRRAPATRKSQHATAGSTCQHDTALGKVLRNRHVRPGDLNLIG